MTIETEINMPRLVWFVLNDGRSVVAGCGSATKEALSSALSDEGSTLTFTLDDAVERIPANAVRDFVFFEARSAVPAATSIYRLVQV